MESDSEALVTREMLGLFVVAGADVIIFVFLLAIGGVISLSVAALVSAVVLAVFGG